MADRADPVGTSRQPATAGGQPADDHVYGPTPLVVLAGRYRLDRVLAAGATSDVWQATDEVLERKVAVKVLREVLLGDHEARERFRRETQLAARLNHRAVVAVYDTISSEAAEAVVQEFVPGHTLATEIAGSGRLSVRDSVRVGMALADALDAVHRSGIVHRDVKPANVLLADDGRVLLTDFGIATRGEQHLTRDDVMQGTAKYLSPEQVEGRPATSSGDLYSLGVVLYECLAGRAPFSADSEAATALARLRGDPIPLRVLRPAVPTRLAALIDSCMARQPDGRPISAAALRHSLTRLLPGLPVEADTEPAPLRPRLRRRRRTERHPSPDAAGAGGTVTATDGAEPPDPAVATSARAEQAATPVRMGALHHWREMLAAGVAIAALVTLVVVAVGSGHERSGATSLPPVQSAVPDVVSWSPLTASSAPDRSPTAPAPQENPVLVSSAEFDPPPGDGKENPAMLGHLLDGDLASYWTSLCYDDPGLGQKAGIGLVFQASASVDGHQLEVVSPTPHWSASAYVSETRPDALGGWGPPVASMRDVTVPTATFELGDSPGRYLLLWFTRLGPGTGCRLPYGLRVSEVRIR